MRYAVCTKRKHLRPSSEGAVKNGFCNCRPNCGAMIDERIFCHAEAKGTGNTICITEHF